MLLVTRGMDERDRAVTGQLAELMELFGVLPKLGACRCLKATRRTGSVAKPVLVGSLGIEAREKKRAVPIDHLERARAAWPLLANRAVNGLLPYTYREICDEIGVHWRSAPCFLGVIRRHCNANGCRRCRCWW